MSLHVHNKNLSSANIFCQMDAPGVRGGGGGNQYFLETCTLSVLKRLCKLPNITDDFTDTTVGDFLPFSSINTSNKHIFITK